MTSWNLFAYSCCDGQLTGFEDFRQEQENSSFADPGTTWYQLFLAIYLDCTRFQIYSNEWREEKYIGLGTKYSHYSSHNDGQSQSPEASSLRGASRIFAQRSQTAINPALGWMVSVVCTVEIYVNDSRWNETRNKRNEIAWLVSQWKYKVSGRRRWGREMKEPGNEVAVLALAGQIRVVCCSFSSRSEFSTWSKKSVTLGPNSKPLLES